MLRGWACAGWKPSTPISILAWNSTTPVKNTWKEGTCMVRWKIFDFLSGMGVPLVHNAITTLGICFINQGFLVFLVNLALEIKIDLKHKRTSKHSVNIF